MNRNELLTAFDTFLQPDRFKDRGPNGLQVEGKAQVRKIVSGVTASLALIEAAIAAGADVLIPGEISEPPAHYAREINASFIACWHHASERYGAPAVAAHVAARFGLMHALIDIDNPA